MNSASRANLPCAVTVSSVRSRVESKHRLSYHQLTWSLHGSVWSKPVIASTDAADKVFRCLPHNSYLYFRAEPIAVRPRLG